ncbi:MAG TPA: DUF6289 family protein [Thermoanaerobaculia bacterium]|nr:DUF6289 family protein [Thermoanaerobaculia bacterium]
MRFLRKSAYGPALVLLLAVFATAFGAALVVAPTADAVPAYGHHYKYYDSPAKTHQVGLWYYDCNRVLKSTWGYKTPYYTVATYGCVQDPW